MGGAEQVEGSSGPAGRVAEAESGQEVAGGSTGMPPVVIADGRESQRAGRVYRSFTFRLAFRTFVSVATDERAARIVLVSWVCHSTPDTSAVRRPAPWLSLSPPSLPW